MMFMNPYSLILWLRHKRYDWRICNSVQMDIPTLSIGNITVGGTGKTPHTELILRLFSQEIPIAVLSRGYKRTSKGFRYVTLNDTVADVGDEPLQIKRKFPNLVVAVDKNRISGINRMVHDHPQMKWIVLDDAFQYRKLIPSYSILLSNYHRPFTQDHLLPFGQLRDLPSQSKRADMIIVTKTPPEVSQQEREHQMKLLRPQLHQQLLFSRYTYSNPIPLFPHFAGMAPLPHSSTTVLVVTGIAHPEPFIIEIEKQKLIIQHLKFPDHHNFTQKDILRIDALSIKYPGIPIYTTEKDAMRLLERSSLCREVKSVLFYISVQVIFCTEKEKHHFIETLRKFQFVV